MTDKEIFEKNIVSALEIEDLPDDKKIELIDKIAAIVEQRISLRLMMDLKEEDHREFEKLGEADRMSYLASKFPEMEQLITDEVVKVKKELIEEMKKDEILAMVESD
jgi:hypothetical protein